MLKLNTIKNHIKTIVLGLGRKPLYFSEKSKNLGIFEDEDVNNNFFSYNNFVNNTNNAYDVGTNVWYEISTQQGNYWDDYNGTDSDGDGIGDIPYNILGGENQDIYPLINLWNRYDVNRDGTISPKDVGLVTYHYGCDPSLLEYNMYDVNDDDSVDPQDVGLIKYNYGPWPS